MWILHARAKAAENLLDTMQRRRKYCPQYDFTNMECGQ